MANNRRHALNHAESRHEYIYGNTVRRLHAVPEPREEIQPEKPKKASRQVRRNRNKAMHMSAGYVVFLTVAAVIALVVCVQFLEMRSGITSQAKEVTRMQQELVTLKDENDTRYDSIMNSISEEEVRERAVNDLGMVYAQAGQIVEYQNPGNDYVKQYEAIPENGMLAASGKVSK